MLKRGFDIIVAALALALTAPILGLAALAVRLTSPGPVLYRAPRAGRDGRLFHMLKLRTMRVGTDSVDRRVTAEGDDRITPVGRLLRKTKVDELPQLWNVLRGEMSIVGPRPEDWEIVRRHYTPAQRRALSVRPGIAAPADVRWYPDLTYHDPPPPGVPIQEHYVRRHLPLQVAESIRYIERRSLLLDIQVLLQIVYCVLVYSWRAPRRRPVPAPEALGALELGGRP